MTKRDYEFLSATINDARQELHTPQQLEGARHIAGEIALALSHRTNAFDVRRFMINCGFEKQ